MSPHGWSGLLKSDPYLVLLQVVVDAQFLFRFGWLAEQYMYQGNGGLLHHYRHVQLLHFPVSGH